jgi:polysaccharide export outer membrane protein
VIRPLPSADRSPLHGAASRHHRLFNGSAVARGLLLAALAISAVATAEEARGNAPATVAVAAGRAYLPIPGDLLRIEVFNEPELATTARMTAVSSLEFPLIGEVAVGGKDTASIATEIQRRLEDGYIRRAPTTVTVLEYAPRQAYVMGSVARQEPVKLNPFSELSALQAIVQVGGFLDDANRNGVFVLRDQPDNKEAKQLLPVKPAPAQAGAPGAAGVNEDVILQPGDMVMVPRLDRIFVIGRVRTPGALSLPGQDHLTVSKALSLAGGFELYARQNQVQLIRAGSPVRVVDVQAILNGDGKLEDPRLKPGDTIFVPESRF